MVCKQKAFFTYRYIHYLKTDDIKEWMFINDLHTYLDRKRQ